MMDSAQEGAQAFFGDRLSIPAWLCGGTLRLLLTARCGCVWKFSGFLDTGRREPGGEER